MTITISVTADDILNGKHCDSVGCPVYLAAKRVIPSLMQVTPARLVLHNTLDMPKLIALPELAVSFIRNFDNHGYCRPFNFEVEVP